MTDISNAALRGTVESGSFVSPYTLKRPFAICSEFGQMSSSGQNSEVIQKLLNVLEEGCVEVSLGKIAFLTKSQRADISKEWGVYFLDNNTFSYRTNWILMAATYNKKFLVDNALESRFNIMYPRKPLDNALTKHVMNSGGFYLDEEVKHALRLELFKEKEIETNIRLPDEIYDVGNVTPRDCGAIKSHILCRSWWNVKTEKDEVVEMAADMLKTREEVWKSADDKVFEAIQIEAKTPQEIAKEVGITTRQAYVSFKKIGAFPVLHYAEDGSGDSIRKWKV